jgi:alpha-galactosidase
MNIVDQNEPLAPFAGPGHWNDPDMLEIGNGGLSTEEYRSHFSLWAMMAAPLIAGNDLTNMSPETRSILLNREVIAIDQDPRGEAGRRVTKAGDFEVWARPLSNGSRAVLLFNRGKTLSDIAVKWSDVGYPDAVLASVRDVWNAKDLGEMRGGYTARQVPAHGVVMLIVTPTTSHH